MVFTSTIFLFAFLPIIIFGYYVVRKDLRNVFLVLASLLFYAWGEPKLILLLIVTILVNYVFGIAINSFKESLIVSRIILLLSFVYNIGILFYFKYLTFTLRTFNLLTGSNISVSSIALPLGISFFVFRCISYVLDVYFQTSKVNKNIINVALYISFFPQLTMGPITQYSYFENQFEDRKFDLEKVTSGVKRIIVGLGKKLVISNLIAVLVDKAYSMPYNELTVVLAWLGAFCYLIQLYFDFSGYSDVAVGLSSIFGFDCVENFDYPYISKNIGEFWRRWHISLGNWLRDYLYTPMFRFVSGKNNPITKSSFSIQECDITALFVVWICCGAWHGAGLKFIIYGLYYYAFIVGERILQDKRKKKRKKLKLPKHKETKFEAIRAHIYAMVVVFFGQILFRADSLHSFFEYIKCMFGLNGNTFINEYAKYVFNENLIVIILGTIFCFPIAKKVEKICKVYALPNKISNVLVPIGYLALLVIDIAFAVTNTYNAFIYFNF